MRGLGAVESYYLLQSLERQELGRRLEQMKDLTSIIGNPTENARYRMIEMLRRIYEGHEEEMTEEMAMLATRS